MPCYPALALLIGSAMATDSVWMRRGTRVLIGIALSAAVVVLGLAFLVRNYPAPGDISMALISRPGSYTLALDHMRDLTLPSFAYLRMPFVMAGVAFLVGAAGMLWGNRQRAFFAAAVMMVLFFHAARAALVVFDPYLSSRPLAEALLRAPEGKLIVDHHYYTYSSVFFYTNRTALLLNGRINNLVYGSYAPGAPDVFIDDEQFRQLWLSPDRYYIVAGDPAMPRLEKLAGKSQLNVVAASGGKVLLTNHL